MTNGILSLAPMTRRCSRPTSRVRSLAHVLQGQNQPTNKAPFMIGAQPPNGGGPLKGMIDEVAVYDTALDEKEAQVGASLTANTTKVMHSL